TSSTDGLSNTTGYTNYLNASAEFVRKTTYPDLSTRIETYGRDGSLLKVSGTAVRALRYEYGVQSDEGWQRRFTKEIKVDVNGHDTTEWTKSFRDGAERLYKVLFADSTSGTEVDNPYSETVFDDQRRVTMQI